MGSIPTTPLETIFEVLKISQIWFRKKSLSGVGRAVKALVRGTSSKERGFKSHTPHKGYFWGTISVPSVVS